MNILLFTFPAATYSVIKTMSIHTFNYIKLLTRNYDFFHLVLLLYLRVNLVLFYKKYTCESSADEDKDRRRTPSSYYKYFLNQY